MSSSHEHLSLCTVPYNRLVAISLFLIVCDAFSICSLQSLTRRADINEFDKRSMKLNMVTQLPTSDTVLGKMLILDNQNNRNEHSVEQEDESLKLSTMDTMEIKRRLLDLLPRMTGTVEEFKSVESYVNALEDRYIPVQTLDFLNLVMSGEWQLVFSTNLSGLPKLDFRLRDLYQVIEANDFNGTIVNEATWDLAQDHHSTSPAAVFDASGTFSIKCSYSIDQGSRMIVELKDHVINLAKGSSVPKDVEGLVALLYRAIPTELFDPNDHAMDTTYLDGDLRIVRMAGPKFEAVRDIFIRRGSMQINPVYCNVFG